MDLLPLGALVDTHRTCATKSRGTTVPNLLTPTKRLNISQTKLFVLKIPKMQTKQPILLNYTPHDVHLYTPDGKTLLKTWPREPAPILLQPQDTQQTMSAKMDGVNVPLISRPAYLDPVWPPQEELVARGACGLIVSQLVAERVPTGLIHGIQIRLFTPDTGPEGAVRDDQGRIIGCKRLIYWYL